MIIRDAILTMTIYKPFVGNEERNRLRREQLREENQVHYRYRQFTWSPEKLKNALILFCEMMAWLGMSKNGLDNDDGDSSEDEAPVVLSEAQG